ncbi:MAG: SURF1 family protein [Marinosulfonomonas sp.]|nr:SURF1 family protein [Marinosulfonomonas sp.]
MTRQMIVPLLFGILGAAILIWLGSWQMQRLGWKQDVLAKIEARIGATPASQLAEFPDPEGHLYLPLQLAGKIEQPELHVLVSRKQIGAGYRIIVPFEVAGRRILLDRGFVRAADKDASRRKTVITVTGNLLWPDDRTNSTPQNDEAKNIWFARDLDAMADVLQTEPVLLVAKSNTGDSIEPLPVQTSLIPNDHLQYAITWFLLAIVWLGMTGFLLWRIKRRTA